MLASLVGESKLAVGVAMNAPLCVSLVMTEQTDLTSCAVTAGIGSDPLLSASPFNDSRLGEEGVKWMSKITFFFHTLENQFCLIMFDCI